MRQDLPFSTKNRPWLSTDCIDAMNEQFMNCVSQIPPENREALREWAAVKVEMGYCLDRPSDVHDKCLEWGKLRGWDPTKEAAAER